METNEPRLPEQGPNAQPPERDTEPQPAEELDELQTRVRNYPEKTWLRIQRVGGAALGVICGLLLTYFANMESIGMIGTIGAALIALLAPNMIEKRVRRSIQKGRVALMIAFAVWLAGYTALMLIKGVPIIKAS